MQLLQYTASLPEGSGQCNSFKTLPHCLRAVGSETAVIHCFTAWAWAVQLLPCTALLLGGSARCNSCNKLPHRLGALGIGTPATHCLIAWGQWVVQLLQYTASQPAGSG